MHVRSVRGVWLTRRALQVLFNAWYGCTKAEMSNWLAAEAGRLNELVPQETSIWRMKTEQLVEVFIDELGITRSQAEKEIAQTLRQKIKANRDMLNTVADPLDEVPKGLGRMSHAELCKEMEKRGLHMPAGQRGAHRANTKGYMIVAIKDHVEQRRLLSTHQVPQTEANLRVPATNSTDGADWMAIDTPREEPQRPRPTSRRRER